MNRRVLISCCWLLKKTLVITTNLTNPESASVQTSSYREYTVLSCTFLFYTHTSSRPEVFCKKGVLENFTKFTGKHLCQSLFFNKVVGLSPATLLKKELWHGCFPVNFAKFSRTLFFIEHLWWLLLHSYLFS